MKHGLKCFFSLSICGALLLAVASCATSLPAGKAEPFEPGKPVLRVGIRPNAPPFIFVQAGAYAGIEADLARDLARQLNMNLQFVESAWDDLIPGLLDGKFDIIMSGMTITSQRSVRIAFTDPYLTAGQACLVRNELQSKFPTPGLVQFTDMRVGFEDGTTGAFIVQRDMTRAKPASFANPEKGAQALIDKRIDLFVHDAPVVWWLAATYEAQGLTSLPFFLTREDIGWGMRKDDLELQASANRFIEVWKRNGRLKELLHQWLPSSF